MGEGHWFESVRVSLLTICVLFLVVYLCTFVSQQRTKGGYVRFETVYSPYVSNSEVFSFFAQFGGISSNFPINSLIQNDPLPSRLTIGCVDEDVTSVASVIQTTKPQVITASPLIIHPPCRIEQTPKLLCVNNPSIVRLKKFYHVNKRAYIIYLIWSI